MEQKNKKTTVDRRAWPVGVLTDEVIKKSVKLGSLPRAITFSVAAVVLAITAWPTLMTVTDLDLRAAALLAGILILLALAIKEWMGLLNETEYCVEADRITDKQMQVTYEDKDAQRLDLPTKIPVLMLEKHGSYRIEPAHIHKHYTALELFHTLEEGEEVYIIYSRQGKKLLRIFRKKYWTLPDSKE